MPPNGENLCGKSLNLKGECLKGVFSAKERSMLPLGANLDKRSFSAGCPER